MNAYAASPVRQHRSQQGQRCPACEQVVFRIVKTIDAIYLDARGATYLRLARGTP